MIFDIIQSGHMIHNIDWSVDDLFPLFNRIYYVINGEGLLHYNGTNIQLQKDRLYIFPSMQPYHIEQNKSKPLEILWFHIYMHEYIFSDLQEISILPDTINFYFTNILKDFMQKSPLHCEMKQIFHSWIHYLNVEQKFIERSSMDSEMEIISTFVHNHLNQGITVQELADHLNINRSHFSRKFKAKFHISPTDYLKAKKLHYASLLLLQGYSNAKVAEMTGYFNEKSFSRAFKQYIGICPSTYKKKYMLRP